MDDSSELPEDYDYLLSVNWIVICPLATLSVMYFVYGFYVLLFGACVRLMARGQADNRRLYFSCVVALFAIGSAMVVVQTVLVVQQTLVSFNAVKTREFDELLGYIKHNRLKTGIYFLSDIFPAFANIAADIMLIHRCYVIWDFKKRVALPLIFLSFVVNVMFITSAIMMVIGTRDSSVESNLELALHGIDVQYVSQIMSAVVNFLLTVLTAGRIWWIIRRTPKSVRVESATQRTISSVIRIIVESGMIYPLVIIVDLAIVNTLSFLQPVDFAPTMVLAAGIAPTLILVRVKMGKTAEPITTGKISNIEFASHGPGAADTDTTAYRSSQGNVASSEKSGTTR